MYGQSCAGRTCRFTLFGITVLARAVAAAALYRNGVARCGVLGQSASPSVVAYRVPHRLLGDVGHQCDVGKRTRLR